MKPNKHATAVLTALALASSIQAATFTSGATAPAVDPFDISNLGAQTGSDKWFYQSGNESGVTDAAKGQTFTTGSSAILLKALTYKIDPTQKKAANTTYTIRVGKISGTTFTQIARETALQTVTTANGDYITWTFATPVLLSANTVHGIDVAMTSSVSWNTGIPYLGYTGNAYAGGAFYHSGDAGVGSSTIVTTASDRIFHLDMENPATDSDGDGLTNVQELQNGTNPNNPDTDGDALNDGVETNTGIYVGTTNTGTNPLVKDTDGDGVGDWYEVTASLTNPHNAADKANLPYPLPDPDSSTGVTTKPVKVYIMSGQSNMVGFGTRDGTGDNSLETMSLRQNKFPNLVNDSGAWTTRQDVRYRGVISDTGKVQLSPANLGTAFGPELGFGYVMGWHHDEPVLLLKSCTGNRSLGWDVLPPGSPSYQYAGYQYAGFGDSPTKWLIGSTPVPINWYAGKEFDRFFRHESEWAHPDAAVVNVVDVLDNFAKEYPDWATQGFQIAGFVWWQGDKDRYDLGHATRYEPNLVNLITSLRSYYTNRYPGKVATNAPFVLATLGQTPLTSTDPAEKPILDAMLAVDGSSGKYPQFAGNVKTVYAHPLSEGGA